MIYFNQYLIKELTQTTMPFFQYQDNPPTIELSVEDINYLMEISTMKTKELKAECKRTGAKQTTAGWNIKRTKQMNLMATRLGHYNYLDIEFEKRLLLDKIFVGLEMGANINDYIATD